MIIHIKYDLVKSPKITKTSYVVIEQGKTENYEVFRVFRPKIAREVHSLTHRKLRKRKHRGRELRGYTVFGAFIHL